MRLYEIEPHDVAETLQQPSLIQSGEQGKQHAWKKTNRGAFLRVTFKEELEQIVVITVTPKKNIPEGKHEN